MIEVSMGWFTMKYKKNYFLKPTDQNSCLNLYLSNNERSKYFREIIWVNYHYCGTIMTFDVQVMAILSSNDWLDGWSMA